MKYYISVENEQGQYVSDVFKEEEATIEDIKNYIAKCFNEDVSYFSMDSEGDTIFFPKDILRKSVVIIHEVKK